MPTYVFKCPDHEYYQESIMSMTLFSSSPRPQCECGKTMETVIGSTSFALKGKGWARDGYSGSKK